MKMLATFKFVLILTLLLAGTVFLLKGFGVDVPLVKFSGGEARNLPAGGVLLLAAVLLAKFWRIRVRTESTTTTTYESPGKEKSTTMSSGRSTVDFKGPNQGL
jgi:hypothetical protein